ncbi:MAG: type II toxin-antitoxin system HicB family antitoxin [Nanoarchaeota archaeon]|nr:type II toxin-antitoxin system HicB family antitoxin [Nanoarchaeota archaeon]
MVAFNLIIEKGEDGYLISEVVGLQGCHTQAKNMNDLIERTKEAISLCLQERKSKFKDNLIGLQKIEM